MAGLGPFEARPRLAVAVSGGADSLALCLLAQGWAAARGGEVLALTVDHGLRPDSAAEARQVAAWLSVRKISHRTLRWPGPKPATGIQAAARAARYGLLLGACREAGALHLLLGHHRGDQWETMVMRSRRHGDPGDPRQVAATAPGTWMMAPCLETADGRLLRPLLDFEAPELRHFLAACGQPWLEDPSNADPRFERVRVRRRLSNWSREARERLFGAAAAAEGQAADWSLAVARVLAGACRLEASGVIHGDFEALSAEGPGIGSAALSRILTTVGGRGSGPGRDAVARLYARLAEQPAVSATLHRCRLRRVRSRVEISRELRHLPPPLPAVAGTSLHWDGRFQVTIGPDVPAGWTLAAAGAGHGAGLAGAAALPALFADGVLVAAAVPAAGRGVPPAGLAIVFQPLRTLSGPGRFVATGDCGTMSRSDTGHKHLRARGGSP